MNRPRHKLAKLVGQSKLARVTRPYPGDPTHHGFVLGLGRELVLLQQFHDFYPEGYTALRVADIVRVRSGEHERFWDRMFRGEGLTERAGITDKVPLDNFGSLLAELQERGQHVIVESEDRQTADHDDFHIGRIIDRDDWSITILDFSALGVWDDKPVVVGIDAITKIQFDTPYINTLTKYLNGPPPE